MAARVMAADGSRTALLVSSSRHSPRVSFFEHAVNDFGGCYLADTREKAQIPLPCKLVARIGNDA